MRKRLANFKFNWKLALFTSLLFPFLVSLGFWQLAREQEKRDLQAVYEQRQSAAARPLDVLDWETDLQYMPVTVTGHYDNEHVFLLDNRIYEGQAGFEVLTPFISDAGDRVVVNRGWMPQGRYRSELPQVERPGGRLIISGSVYVPLGKPFVLGESAATQGWPRVIQQVDMTEIFEEAGLAQGEGRLFPYSIRLSEETPGVLVRNWPVVTTLPEKHRGYAIQWFTMAAVLLLLFFYISTRPETDAED